MRRRRAPGVLLAILTSIGASLAAPGPAVAQEWVPGPPAPPPTAAPSEWRWYGWQSMGLDTVAATFFGLAAQLDARDRDTRDGLIIAGVGVYAFGGPIVHYARGQDGRAWLSLASAMLRRSGEDS